MARGVWWLDSYEMSTFGGLRILGTELLSICFDIISILRRLPGLRYLVPLRKLLCSSSIVVKPDFRQTGNLKIISNQWVKDRFVLYEDGFDGVF